MDQIKRPRGRPKKADNEGTAQQVKKRQYMRNYVGGIKQGIEQLEKDELDCLKDLEKMRNEKSKLINMLDDANKQASNILTEKTKTTKAAPVKKMARPANISLPKPKPKKVLKKSTDDDDVLMTYLKDEGIKSIQGAVRRRLVKK